MFEIAISNEHGFAFETQRMELAISRILTDAKLASALISIAIVDDPTIHDLNRRFLQHDYPTDVLSFLLERTENSLDGEVIASADYAARSAAEYQWPADDELLLYVIHGTLHLVGYDDTDDESRMLMRERERHYLLECGVTPPT